MNCLWMLNDFSFPTWCRLSPGMHVEGANKTVAVVIALKHCETLHCSIMIQREGHWRELRSTRRPASYFQVRCVQMKNVVSIVVYGRPISICTQYRHRYRLIQRIRLTIKNVTMTSMIFHKGPHNLMKTALQTHQVRLTKVEWHSVNSSRWELNQQCWDWSRD